MNSIQKTTYEEHVRYLLLRFPKNLMRVAEEASKFVNREVSIEEVKRIYDKFKKSQSKDINYWVACNLAQEILQGSLERNAKLEAMYQTWDGREIAEASICCNAPVEHIEMGGNSYYRCLACNETCNIKTLSFLDLEELKMKILKQMREESSFLIKMAKEMGFTTGAPKIVEKNQQFIYVDQRKDKVAEPVNIDASVGKDLENMSPMEREAVLKRLEKMQANEIEAEFEGKGKE